MKNFAVHRSQPCCASPLALPAASSNSVGSLKRNAGVKAPLPIEGRAVGAKGPHGVRAFLFLSFAILFPALLAGQQTQLGFSNSPPAFGHGHDYIQSLNETVNPADGSLTLNIGVPTPSGRGLNLSYAITYNSSIMHSFSQIQGPDVIPSFMVPASVSNNMNFTLGGWSDTLPKLVVEHTPYAEVDSMPPENDQQDTLIICEAWQGFQFTDVNGRSHQPNLNLGNLYSEADGCNLPLPGGRSDVTNELALQGHGDINAADFATADGTYYEFSLASVWPGGSDLIYPQLIEDKNGNKLSIVDGPNNYNSLIAGTSSLSPAGSISVVDTLGRNVVSLRPADASDQLLYVSGIPKPYNIHFGPVPALSGVHTPQSSLIVSGGEEIEGSTADTLNAFPASSGAGYNLTSITLPDGGSYNFTYDSVFGNVNKITYPNGGYVSYTWGFPGGYTDDANYGGQYVKILTANNAFYTPFRVYIQYAMPVILHRAVSFDGNTIALTQDFTYSTTFRQGDMMDGWISKTTTVTTHDLVAGTSSSVTYSYSPFTEAGQNPSQRYTGQTAQEYQTIYKDGSGNVLQTTCKTWIDNIDILNKQTTILANGMVSEHDFDYTGTGPSGAPTGGDDYDFSAPQSNATCANPWVSLTEPTPGPLLRSTRQTSNTTATSPISLYPYGPSIGDTPDSTITKDGSGNIISETDYTYTNAIAQTVSGVVQHDTALDSGSQVRQNLQSVTKKCFSSCTAETTTYAYDNTGQVVSATDGRGNTTTYSHADMFASGTGQPSGGAPTDAYVTQVTAPSTNGVAHVSKMTYGYSDGKARTGTDQNGNVTTYCYWTGGCSGSVYDPWMRLTQVTFPDGGSQSAVYNDSGSNPSVTQTTVATPSPNLVQTTIGDGMGHAIHSQTTSDPTGTVTVDTVYGGTGAVFSTSNPYRSTSDSTYGVTTYTYDGLGRKILQQQPDGSLLQWCYDGIASSSRQTVCSPNWSSMPNATWVDSADQAGNHMQHVSDGLGRLLAAIEPTPAGNPNTLSLETDYTYDALNNLKSVLQKGNPDDSPQNRSFSYDSLSRLITSTNPETGTLCYGTWQSAAVRTGPVIRRGPPTCIGGYDANGNLLYKTDARGATVSYSYDALNRLTNKQSSGAAGVPGFNFTYGYDAVNPAVANGIGRLLYTLNGQGETEQYWYDAMGRMTSQSVYPLSAPHTAVNASAKYDLAGNMTDLTYPDGRHIKQTFDGAGRLQTSTLHDINGVAQSQSYLTSIMYNPDGSPQVTTLGNGVRQTSQENNRLQVQSMSAAFPIGSSTLQPVLSHTYCYVNCTTGGTANNGNIWGITDTLNGTRTQGFTYDNLNRIGSFTLGGALNQQYAIDSFGNLSGVVNGNAARTFDPATNRINNLPCAASVPAYDAAGNQLCDSDPYGNIRQYTFDAESRISQIATINNSASPFVTYSYSADGDRVGKSNSDGTFTDYLNFNGQTIAELDQTGAWTDYIFAGGKRIAKISPLDNHIDIAANDGGGGFWQWYDLGVLHGYTVRQGDKLNWRQYQSASARGGMLVETAQGGDTAWSNTDQNGNLSNQDSVTGIWESRSVDLSSLAGQQINLLAVGMDSGTTGNATIDYADISMVSVDGTVQTIYNGQAVGLSAWPGNRSMANPQAQFVAQAVAGPETHFYLGDHLGTAQFEFTASGYPVWQGQFAPFGAELDSQTTANHYKFTGKERDTESGLDYFGARYNSSAMGRFISPDWSSVPDTVPHAIFSDPQSLNLYSYTANNPINYSDPDGHQYTVCDQNGQCNHQDDKTFEQAEAGARSVGDVYSHGTITLADGSAGGSYHWDGPDIPGDAASNIAALGNIGNGGMAAINEFVIQSTIGAATEGAGQLIGIGVDAYRAGRAIEAINTGSNVVYQSLNAAGDVEYVGITNNLARRAGEHAGRGFQIEAIPGLSNLSRADARAVEQVLIETHGLASEGGTLVNKINSIASTNPAYAQALQRGAQILKQVGYFK